MLEGHCSARPGSRRCVVGGCHERPEVHELAHAKRERARDALDGPGPPGLGEVPAALQVCERLCFRCAIACATAPRVRGPISRVSLAEPEMRRQGGEGDASVGAPLAMHLVLRPSGAMSAAP